MNIPEAIFSHKKRKIPQKTTSNHYMYAKTYNKGQYLPYASCSEKPVPAGLCPQPEGYGQKKAFRIQAQGPAPEGMISL